jgi:hypothetical protein
MTHSAKSCDAPKIGYGQNLLKDIWCLPKINCPLGGDARCWKTLNTPQTRYLHVLKNCKKRHYFAMCNFVMGYL